MYKRQLFDIDSSTVLAWREHLIGLGLSNNSVANRLSALSSLFRHLCDKQVVQTNPVQGIKRPKHPHKAALSIANKLVRQILDDSADRLHDAKTATAALTAARNSAILHVLFFLGSRVSEVVSLKVVDIITAGEYTTVVKLTVKGGQALRVPAPLEALAAVNEYLAMSGHAKGCLLYTSPSPRD